MLLNKELNERLVSEFRYATTKMQETSDPAKKLYYFSVLFGEAQRLLNQEWNRELALVNLVTQQVYQQINSTLQDRIKLNLFPIDWEGVLKKLTESTAELTAYTEKAESNQEQLCQILAHFAEIAYVTLGNGSFMYEKGIIKL